MRLLRHGFLGLAVMICGAGLHEAHARQVVGDDPSLPPPPPRLEFIDPFLVDLDIGHEGDATVRLRFGVQYRGLDESTDRYDRFAPPLPPAGGFDARLRNGSDDLLYDIRSVLGSEKRWLLLVEPVPDASPVQIRWNTADPAAEGTIRLRDVAGTWAAWTELAGEGVLTLPGGATQLEIVWSKTVSVAVQASTDWNLVGMPVESTELVTTHFPTIIPNTLFRYAGRYESPDPPVLSPGTGYWLRLPEATTATLTGRPVRTVTLNLTSGWNLVSGPTCDLPIAGMIDPGGIVIPNTIYWYDGSYRSATVFSQGRGYWLRTATAGTVILTCAASKAAAPPPVVRGGILRLRDALGTEYELRVGIPIVELANPLAFSVPPPAPGSTWQPQYATGKVAIGIGESGTISLVDASFPVRVSLLNEDPASYSLSIVGSDNRVEPLADFLASGSAIIESGRQLVVEEAVPSGFNLLSSYPNPFGADVTIVFQLDHDARVVLEVIDLQGRTVAALLSNDLLPAGRHDVRLDAGSLSSGTYLVRFDDGRRSLSRPISRVRY